MNFHFLRNFPLNINYNMYKNQKSNDPNEVIMRDIEIKRNKWEEECLNEIRTRGSKSISIAIWRNDLNLAEIKIVKGQHLKTVGMFIKGVQYLYPEECLSLVERGKIVVYDSYGNMLSIQDLYQKLDDGGIKISTYNVYNHLKRLGYIIFRHNNEEDNDNIILYDVYEPNSSFSRKNPDPISFILCISDEDVKFEDIYLYLEKYKETPIKLGIYTSGNIPSFYTIKSK